MSASTDRTFTCRNSIRTAATVLAGLNVAAILVALAVAVIVDPVGVLFVVVFAWGAIETGRAAWVNRHELTVADRSLRIDGPAGRVEVPFDRIVWTGLTRRGLVVDTLDGRADFFDQDWATTIEAHDVLRLRVGQQRPERVVVHEDQRLSSGRFVVAAATAAMFLGLSLIAVAADVSIGERIAVLATTVPVGLLAARSAWSRLRAPLRLELTDDGAVAQRLFGTATASGTAQVVPAPTVVQRLAGSDPATAIGVGRLQGPAAAPGSFDHLV